MLKKILTGIVVLLVAIQFFGIRKDVPEHDSSASILKTLNPPNEVSKLMKDACFDCHSYETKYPWYANVEPISWILRRDIREGREYLNFSIWDEYSAAGKSHRLFEAVEMISTEEMPLKAYTIMHPEARLSNKERATLAEWMGNKAGEVETKNSGDEGDEAEKEHEEHDHE